MSLPEVCPECGNDEVAEGFDLCSDCLETQIPQDSFVLWCRDCFTSLMWKLADAQTYDPDEWGEAVIWAMHQSHRSDSHGFLPDA